MSALVLTSQWCETHDLAAPIAVTVDHGLREASAAEAKQVAAWARTLGVRHVTLKWKGDKPTGNIQAAAREARYRLIGEWARSEGIGTLITGHTLDDQAETFLLRLARGSGLDGLAGMAQRAPFPLREFDDLVLLRPLLAFSHDRLVATLQTRSQLWLEDPSNDATRFERARLRQAKSELAALGLTAERLADAAAHLRRAREAIDDAVAALLADAVQVSPWGYALVRSKNFATASREVALRALSRLIAAIGGEPYPPRFDALEAACSWLAGAGTSKGRTLGGCRLARRGEQIMIAREEADVAAEGIALAAGERKIWDGRFRIALAAKADGAFSVRALGAKGLSLAGRHAELPPIEPRRIAVTTPALWSGERLVAAPLANYFAANGAGLGFSVDFLGLAEGKGNAKGKGP